MSLVLRQKAVDAVMAAYQGQAFAWGRKDCARMAACLVKAMGHKVSLVRFGAYRSAAGATSAIRRGGYDSVEAMLDERFARIAAASALPGDIMALASDLPFPALAVYVGNGAALHSWQGQFTVSRVLASEAAWRVPPVEEVAHG